MEQVNRPASKFCSHRDRFDNRCNAPCRGPYCVEHEPYDWRTEYRQRVYFVLAHSVQVVKIGTASNLDSRFSSIAGSSPVPLVMLGSIAGGEQVERWLHYHLVRDRSHFEWFRWTERVRRTVEHVLGRGDYAADSLCPKHINEDRAREAGKAIGAQIGAMPSARGDVEQYIAENRRYVTPLVVPADGAAS